MIQALLVISAIAICQSRLQAQRHLEFHEFHERRQAGLGVLVEAANGQGVRIVGVYRASPAEAAGLAVDDIILRINGNAVSNTREFVAMVRRLNPGDYSTLEILRDERKSEIEVVLTTKEQALDRTRYQMDWREYRDSQIDERVAQYRRPNDWTAHHHSTVDQSNGQIDEVIDIAESTSRFARELDHLAQEIRVLQSDLRESQNEQEVVAGFPVFKLPAPRPHSSYLIPQKLWRSRGEKQTYGDVENYLRTALTSARYYDVKLFKLSERHEGFALVTPPEQTTKNGTPEEEHIRWNTEVKPLIDEGFNMSKFLRGLFTARPGYFRSFVFILSTDAVLSDDRATDLEEIIRWNQMGASRLSPLIARKPVIDSHQLEVLVYRFSQEDKGRPVTVQQDLTPAKKHLERAGLWQALSTYKVRSDDDNSAANTP